MSVYFIQYGNSSRIKIGHASEPLERIRNFQCGCPEKITILALIDGGRETERAIHQRFAHLKVRARGEWFMLDDELRAFVASPEAVEATQRLRQTKSIGAAQHLKAAWLSRRYSSDDEMCWIFGMDRELLQAEFGPSGRPEYDSD